MGAGAGHVFVSFFCRAQLCREHVHCHERASLQRHRLSFIVTLAPFSQPVIASDEVKSAPSNPSPHLLSPDRIEMRGGSCGRGKGQATASDAAAVQGETRLARAGDGHMESDARLAMQLSLQVGLCCDLKFTTLLLHLIIICCCCFVNCQQELGGVYHSPASDDFPLMRAVSEGSGLGGGAAAAAGAWGRGGAGGGQSFAAAVGSSFWDGGGKRVQKAEVKAPAPAVPAPPKGAWGKK